MHDSWSDHTGRRLGAEMRTTATPEDVWKAWTDPAFISKWFADEARGETKAGDEVLWTFHGFGDVRYHVAVAEPPSHLVLTGDIPGRGAFALEIRIQQEEGASVVRLVNSGFLDGSTWDEEYEGVRSGWDAALAVLKHFLERHFGSPRYTALIVRPADVEPDDLYRYFSEPACLARWLTREGAIGTRSDRVSLVVRGGAPLSGRVIAATGREKAFTWEEEGASVVELKGFAGPQHRLVGVRITTWGDDQRLPRLENLLTPAVDELAALFAVEPSLHARGAS